MFPLHNSGSGTATRGQVADVAPRCPVKSIFGSFVPRNIVIRPQQMLKIMGYRDGGPVRPAVRRTANSVAELAAAAMTPVVHYARLGVTQCYDGGLSLADGTVFQGPVFAKHLSGCREAMAFIMTLGGKFDSTQKNLTAAGNTLEAVFMETAGWVAIEEVTRLFTGNIRNSAKAEGLDLSRRLAPGYVFRVGDRKVDWPLEEQKSFFGIFEGVKLPVELLESCAMMPKMSRTGLFGFRPNAERGQDA